MVKKLTVSPQDEHVGIEGITKNSLESSFKNTRVDEKNGTKSQDKRKHGVLNPPHSYAVTATDGLLAVALSCIHTYICACFLRFGEE